MKNKGEKVKETLTLPVEVRQSKKDESVYLHYADFENKYICVVVRRKN